MEMEVRESEISVKRKVREDEWCRWESVESNDGGGEGGRRC